MKLKNLIIASTIIFLIAGIYFFLTDKHSNDQKKTLHQNAYQPVGNCQFNSSERY